jgi:ankyrin repeat protein
MIASYSGAIDVVKEYLKVDANVKAKDEKGWTALHHASANGYKEIVQLLLSHQAALTSKEGYSLIDDTSKTTTPLHLAVENGHIKVVKILLNHLLYESSLTDGQNRAALHLAVKKNNLEIFKLLLPTNNPINVCGGKGKLVNYNNLYLTETIFWNSLCLD